MQGIERAWEETMNPLYWPDPRFLAFYTLLVCVTLLLFHAVRRAHERRPLPDLGLEDPYLFACLNGGPREVIRVSMAGLADRGVLEFSGGVAQTREGARPDFGHARIELQILEHFKGGASLETALEDQHLLSIAIADYENRLRSHGLLPDADDHSFRRTCLVAAIAVLVGIGAAKALIAPSSGETVFLIILMMAVAILVAAKISSPYLTRSGEDYLASIQSLFMGLRRRASAIQPASGSREVLWLTALFGVTALPPTAFPFVSSFEPRKEEPKKKDRDSGCGGFYGSGGGSCGGGSGCGGGGGGCGGGGS